MNSADTCPLTTKTGAPQPKSRPRAKRHPIPCHDCAARWTASIAPGVPRPARRPLSVLKLDVQNAGLRMHTCTDTCTYMGMQQQPSWSSSVNGDCWLHIFPASPNRLSFLVDFRKGKKPLTTKIFIFSSPLQSRHLLSIWNVLFLHEFPKPPSPTFWRRLQSGASCAPLEPSTSSSL